MTTDSFITVVRHNCWTTHWKIFRKRCLGWYWGTEPVMGWKAWLPKNFIESINAKVTANQRTLQRQQKLNNVKLRRICYVNRLMVKLCYPCSCASRSRRHSSARWSLRQNPNVMELEAINKWNGQLRSTWLKGLTLLSLQWNNSPKSSGVQLDAFFIAIILLRKQLFKRIRKHDSY